MKGILVFYVNFPVDSNKDVKEILGLTREFNKEWLNKIINEGYEIMFVPTISESSRVEKVDFDKPFPRFVLPHVDIMHNDTFIHEATKDVFQETGE